MIYNHQQAFINIYKCNAINFVVHMLHLSKNIRISKFVLAQTVICLAEFIENESIHNIKDVKYKKVYHNCSNDTQLLVSENIIVLFI